MTIEQELLNNTPLPLDIIRYCIEPFLIPDQAHWRKQFGLVVKSLDKYQHYISDMLSLLPRYPNVLMSFEFTDDGDNRYHVKYSYGTRNTTPKTAFNKGNSYGTFFYTVQEDKVIQCISSWTAPTGRPPAKRVSGMARFWSWIKGSCSL